MTIGSEVTYTGTAHRWMHGLKVKIVRVHRGPDPDEAEILDDARDVGELQADDVVEVVPWIAAEGRWSWATSDATPAELS